MVARVMHNFGLKDLIVVSPRNNWLNNKSINAAKKPTKIINNIKVILEDCGSCWEKIIDVQVFLTNMKDDFKKYNKIYADYFSDNQPTRTTIEIKSLPTPIAIELKVIATI